MAQKGSTLIIIVILTLIVALLGGYLIYQSRVKTTTPPQPFDSAQGKPTTQTSPTTDPTANWETYTNSTFGFAIKYSAVFTPKEEIIDNETAISFLDAKNKSGTPIIIYIKKSDLKSATEYTKWTIEGHVIVKLLEEKPVSLAGVSGVRLHYELDNSESWGKDLHYVILERNGLTYTLQSKGDLNQFNQILSTFRFD